jgi:hypothetical protein
MELHRLINIEGVDRYLRSCQLADGGYFFARVPPASGMDTWYALASFRLLGRRPPRIEATIRWVKETTGWSGMHPHGLYLRMRLLETLGLPLEPLRKQAQELAARQGESGSFAGMAAPYAEVDTPLQTTYEAVVSLKALGVPFDEQRTAAFVLAHLSEDHGVGTARVPSAASTCYAVLTLVALDRPVPTGATAYLRSLIDGRMPSFLDHLHWPVVALTALGIAPPDTHRIASFVSTCQRPNGGFARAPLMGITTLESTYHAIRILSACAQTAGCSRERD